MAHDYKPTGMKKAFLSWLLPLSAAVLFFASVVMPPSYFNALPFQIHETILQGDKNEAEFIIAFDTLFAIGIFFLVRYLLKGKNVGE